MGGASSSKDGGKNAYFYAKRLGISKTIIMVDSEVAAAVWEEGARASGGAAASDSVTSVEAVGRLLKLTAGRLVSAFQKTHAESMKAAEAKSKKAFRQTLARLEESLTRELEGADAARSFLGSLKVSQLSKGLFVACLTAGLTIRKDGTIQWAYVSQSKIERRKSKSKNSKSSKGEKKRVGGSKGKSERKGKTSAGGAAALAVPEGAAHHKKAYSQRQLRVLSKGIYGSGTKKKRLQQEIMGIGRSETDRNTAETASTPAVPEPASPELASPELASPELASPGPAIQITPAAVVASTAAPEASAVAPKRSVAEVMADKKGKGGSLPRLTGERWQSKRLKALAKFATLNAQVKKKKKKKKKKSAKKAKREAETGGSAGDVSAKTQ